MHSRYTRHKGIIVVMDKVHFCGVGFFLCLCGLEPSLQELDVFTMGTHVNQL